MMGRKQNGEQRNSRKSSATQAARDSQPGIKLHASPLIVGIGASAGGLEAFTTFFANMPVM